MQEGGALQQQNALRDGASRGHAPHSPAEDCTGEKSARAARHSPLSLFSLTLFTPIVLSCETVFFQV